MCVQGSLWEILVLWRDAEGECRRWRLLASVPKVYFSRLLDGCWIKSLPLHVSRDQHRNMYVIYSETDHQPRLDAWDKCSGPVHWEDPEESSGEGGGGGGSGWGIHVTPWLIHVSVWQNPLQYCKVISLQLIKINEKNKKIKACPSFMGGGKFSILFHCYLEPVSQLS